MASDLTTVAAVKTYLGLTGSGTDALIASLIPTESRLIETFCNRRFPSATRTRRFNGLGSDRMLLPDGPILGISSLNVGGKPVIASPDGVSSGFMIDGSVIYLIGDSFPRGAQNIAITWEAGYGGAETDNVPIGLTLSPSGDDGPASVDNGVIYAASGAPLVAVQGNVTTGHYSFNGGVYTFAAGDTGASVTMSFRTIPSMVQQACNEMVGIDISQRSNLGISSKVMGTETVVFSDTGLTKSVMAMLYQYKQWAPV